MGGGISYSNKLSSSSSSLVSINSKTILNNRYQIQSILGCGNYSMVFKAFDSLRKNTIAIKEIKITENIDPVEILDIAFMELKILKKIGTNPNIITLQGAFVSNYNCYFVIDYLDGGDLRSYLKTYGALNEQTVSYIICSIGSALNYLHLLGILHRDIKPENIGLTSTGLPRLMDFGISLISTNDNPIPISQSSSGTLPYLAPEVLAKDNYHSYQADFWSLGVVAYEMFYNNRPFPRHCPLPFITYVTNKYGQKWEELKLMKNITIHDLNEDFFIPIVQLPLRENESELHLESRSTIEATLKSVKEEREEVEEGEKEENSDDNVIEEKELTPPKIYIPCHRKLTHYDPIPTPQFISLLTQLLEVQIPLRLGNIKQYHYFENHECFQLYNYHPSTLLMSPTPLNPKLFGGFPLGNSSEVSNPSNVEEYNIFKTSLGLSGEVKHRLLEFSYTNPENNSFLNFCRDSWDEYQTKIRSSGTIFSSQFIHSNHDI